jgi:hypothetical protein
MELDDTDLLASYLRVSLVCYLLLLLLRQVMYVRLCKRHIGLYCITSYMNSNNNNRHMHACLVCALLASYMHVAHSFPVRIPYMNLTAVKFMGSLGFQHTELHLVCIVKAYITVNSVGKKQRLEKMYIYHDSEDENQLTFIISFLAGDDMGRSS